MSPSASNQKSLIRAIIEKGSMKQEVYRTTFNVFNTFKQASEEFVNTNKGAMKKAPYPLLFEYSDRSTFEFQLKFGSDILIFFMHSNVFEIPRDHAVMKSSYIREDKSRSYCGIIHIFNFLADSFRYNRTNDIGYCIGRIFVNRENHYFTEGKRLPRQSSRQKGYPGHPALIHFIHPEFRPPHTTLRKYQGGFGRRDPDNPGFRVDQDRKTFGIQVPGRHGIIAGLG